MAKKTTRAITSLRVTRGEAVDLIGWAKRDNIPYDTQRAQGLVSELERCIDKRDCVAATRVTADLRREMFNLRAQEAKPFVLAGRKQRASLDLRRETHNKALHLERAREWKRWNEAAAPHWKPSLSKNAAARIVKKKLALEGKGTAIPTIAKRLKKPQQAS